MTVDERLVFLLQSTESLHSSLQELHGTVQDLKAIVGRHDGQIDKIDPQLRPSGEYHG